MYNLQFCIHMYSTVALRVALHFDLIETCKRDAKDTKGLPLFKLINRRQANNAIVKLLKRF